MQKCSQVFRYAIATGRAKGDPTWDLRGALEPVESKNRAALTDPGPVGGLLRAIDGYVGQPVTQAALKLHPRRSSTNVLRRSIETTLLNGHSR
jgi:hypothetical protein